MHLLNPCDKITRSTGPTVVITNWLSRSLKVFFAAINCRYMVDLVGIQFNIRHTPYSAHYTLQHWGESSKSF
jgi:hypothetical protein